MHGPALVAESHAQAEIDIGADIEIADRRAAGVGDDRQRLRHCRAGQPECQRGQRRGRERPRGKAGPGGGGTDILANHQAHRPAPQGSSLVVSVTSTRPGGRCSSFRSTLSSGWA
ncbi:hypothetical protein IP88_01720 [alpha proteobacterium AAP81b]|nr:hypothetical protein IP88_01720 [alpha proteobacterium AAP81b]